MARWMLKAAVQGSIALLPRSQLWNYLLQKHITRSIDLNEARLRSKLELYARRHIENSFDCRARGTDRLNVLELGTGWYPILPIAFYLCGASKIWTIDKQPLLRPENVKRTVRLFADIARREDLSAILPHIQKDRIDVLLSLDDDANLMSTPDLLANLNIHACVQDASRTELEPGSVDFVFSNGVLNEIPEQILLAILTEFRRVAPNATMSHYINLMEPFAVFDPSLSSFHFLQYSDTAWKLLNNSLHCHNRLRISDYRRIHESAGFRILSEQNERGSQEELDKVHLADKFQRYSRDDLLVLYSWIVSAPQN